MRRLSRTFHRAFDRLLDWSPADKCIFTAALILIFGGWYTAAEYYYIRHPEIAPYANYPVCRLMFLLQLYVVMGGWLGVAVAGLILRRWAPCNLVLVYVVTVLFAIEFSLTTYALGTHTSVFTGAILIGGSAYGFILFDKRPALAGVATFVAIIVATTIAEQLQWIPYAPALLAAPFTNGRLELSWLANIGGTTFVLLLALVVVMYQVIYRWHDTTEQLARANDLISRYVASQVAHEILSGNYGEVERRARRKLTLFFSDVRGFDEFADRTEPEDVSRVLNEYLCAMTEIAERYEATVDKFIGDVIIIFFGAPVATDDRDHALRAVQMAIEMQQRLALLRQRWELEGIEDPFQIRIGINTGVASVGNFGSQGRLDYTAIGRQVNLAARLQVACEPGRILLSHSTWALVHDAVPCVPKGEIQLKGLHHPVPVYEVATEGPASTAGGAVATPSCVA